MRQFDYSLEAGLYLANGMKLRGQRLKYRRFLCAAEAIRFAMEDLPSLGGCSLEVEDQRFVGAAIRALYESIDFPLQRRLTRGK